MTKSAQQLFIENLTKTLLTIVKVALLSKLKIKLPKKDNRECVILGNGPSFKKFINEKHSFLVNKSVCCVNFFGRTEYFEKVKPSFYFITSPEYFVGEKKESWVNDRSLTLETIAKRTSWPMYFIVPALAQKSNHWRLQIDKNPNITVVFFNNTPIEGFNTFKNWCFKRNLGIPRPHNVLIPSIMLCLNMEFEKIYLTGADHSWTKELFVTEGNQVLLSQKHFYESKNPEDKNSSSPKPMYIGGSQNERKLHEVLEKFVISFRSYWEIKSYAKYLKRKVINITPGSFIDAFERLNIYEE